MPLTATPESGLSAAEDAHYLRRALSLAGRARTHPNPMVGAVIVKKGQIVGEGWHKGVGTSHAEAMALTNAGEQARGATLYVTLEPCSHTVRSDGTPRLPCARRCVDAGIAHVVAALEDPDTQVSGQGFALLRAAGIAVTVGVEAEKARAASFAYLHHRTTGLPFITHKAAMTLDGKIAAPGGDSRWVTGDESRTFVHRLRNRADAIVTGVGTVLADDPALTTRLTPPGNGHDPLRVIIDSRLRTPPTAKVARRGTLLLTTENGDGSGRRSYLEETGAEVMVLPSEAGERVAVSAVAALLAERGLLDILLESGGELAASFWSRGLVNRALFFVAPKIIGGSRAATPVMGEGLSTMMADAAQLGPLTIRHFGPDIAIQAEVLRKDVHRNH